MQNKDARCQIPDKILVIYCISIIKNFFEPLPIPDCRLPFAVSLFSKILNIRSKYLYRNGQQYYAEKFSDHDHPIGAKHFFYPL